MASPEILDFEELLQPISEEAPAGVELKEDPAGVKVLWQVRDARQAARDAEKQWREFELRKEGEPELAPPPAPDWNLVMDLAVTAIAQHSKDLWVAAWLIEALIRLHGFAGLRDGFRLTRELCERFWDGIHPRPDEESGYGRTVNMLAQVTGGALSAPMRTLSSRFTDPDAAAVSPEVLQTVLEDVDQCRDEFTRLAAFLDEHCGKTPEGVPTSPPTSQIQEALESMLLILRGPSSTESSEDADATSQTEREPSTGGTVGGVGGRITSREEGFRVLGLVAQFFRRTEPHSPVSYHIEQAVRWGKMSLPELWVELIPEDARRDVFQRVGMSLPKEKDE
jgi:type VI secretion system protein ImpA